MKKKRKRKKRNCWKKDGGHQERYSSLFAAKMLLCIHHSFCFLCQLVEEIIHKELQAEQGGKLFIVLLFVFICSSTNTRERENNHVDLAIIYKETLCEFQLKKQKKL
jgi:hypothetical protein